MDPYTDLLVREIMAGKSREDVLWIYCSARHLVPHSYGPASRSPLAAIDAAFQTFRSGGAPGEIGAAFEMALAQCGPAWRFARDQAEIDQLIPHTPPATR